MDNDDTVSPHARRIRALAEEADVPTPPSRNELIYASLGLVGVGLFLIGFIYYDFIYYDSVGVHLTLRRNWYSNALIVATFSLWVTAAGGTMIAVLHRFSALERARRLADRFRLAREDKHDGKSRDDIELSDVDYIEAAALRDALMSSGDYRYASKLDRALPRWLRVGTPDSNSATS